MADLLIPQQKRFLIIEPFYGGSHKVLVDLLIQNLGKDNVTFVNLTAKKWHWRARCSALVLTTLIPKVTTEQILFTTSVLNLAELVGLRPDLNPLRKVVYFHENQLVYPVRSIKERDIQYAYNQITTCLAADNVLFNSYYNQNSFLHNIKNVFKIMPDYRPKDLHNRIEPKCKVIYFPIDYSCVPTFSTVKSEILHIVWPHRWEFDKGPETLIRTLLKLKLTSQFRLLILGETFHKIPPVMLEAKQKLADEIISFGFVESKVEFYKALRSAHVVVSTAQHEFFGVSMLEATYCGCFPLVPNRLVYPELYPKQCLYKDEEELLQRLVEYCANPSVAELHWEALNMNFKKFSVATLMPEYYKLLE